mmetsp:Transcript_15380/g.24536  ORF Transcript_15380/g.24536 Transcript_15380/m.24536 type:complete len:682 (+) Transcript_15380:105-2150(+)
MGSKQDVRKKMQLWLKDRDESRMEENFSNLERQYGLDALKSFRRERTKHEHAAVHELVKDGKEEVLKFLVNKKGFDLNVQRSSDQCTPLHLAHWSQPGLVELLLTLRADPSIKNAYGEIPGQQSTADKNMNPLLTGAKTADDILQLIGDRFDDFGGGSMLYAFKLLGEKLADYEPVSCKYVLAAEKRTQLQTSATYQRLSRALKDVACRPQKAMNGSVGRQCLRAILNEMLVSIEEGRISCQAWHGNHIAACIAALAKLGVSPKWHSSLRLLGDALEPQVDALHGGDVVKVLWALGEMRLRLDTLLSAASGRLLGLQHESHCEPQALCMAVWAHIRTQSRNRDTFLRLAEMTKEQVDGFVMNMNVTLPAWCFARGNVADEALFAAIFRKANVTMYDGTSRHPEDVSMTEWLMSKAQLFIAYQFCKEHCPTALDVISFRLRIDLQVILEHRTGITSDLISRATSELLDERDLAELDRMIDNLGSMEEVHFDDSMEMQPGNTPAHDVAKLNAARSQEVLGKEPKPVASFVVLEFGRDPELFHEVLLEAEELSDCREHLRQNGFQVQLNNGTKIFVRPERYGHACEAANEKKLHSGHVLLDAHFEDAVMKAISSLPSKLQVRLKSRDADVLVFVPKTFPSGPYPIALATAKQGESEWEVKRTFIDFPVTSSLHSGVHNRSVKSA